MLLLDNNNLESFGARHGKPSGNISSRLNERSSFSNGHSACVSTSSSSSDSSVSGLSSLSSDLKLVILRRSTSGLLSFMSSLRERLLEELERSSSIEPLGRFHFVLQREKR